MRRASSAAARTPGSHNRAPMHLIVPFASGACDGLRAALRQDRPVYMRIGKKGEPIIHAKEPAFLPGWISGAPHPPDTCRPECLPRFPE